MNKSFIPDDLEDWKTVSMPKSVLSGASGKETSKVLVPGLACTFPELWEMFSSHMQV